MPRTTRNQEAERRWRTRSRWPGRRDRSPGRPRRRHTTISSPRHELYQQRGAADDRKDDWLRAEAELKDERGRRDD
jgi:hypothetical protein